jgi:uncharacterized protein (TIGR02300 family)
MSKEKLGKKILCPSCENKFYDLNRKPIICPKCSNEITPEEIIKKITKQATKEVLATAKKAETVDEEKENDDIIDIDTEVKEVGPEIDEDKIPDLENSSDDEVTDDEPDEVDEELAEFEDEEINKIEEEDEFMDDDVSNVIKSVPKKDDI